MTKDGSVGSQEVTKTINESRPRSFVPSSPTLVERVRGVETSVTVGNGEQLGSGARLL
jgi:hypothetical protein